MMRDTMWNTSSGGSGYHTGAGFGMGNDDDLTTALIVLGRYLMGNPLRDSNNNPLRDSSTTLRDGNTTMHKDRYICTKAIYTKTCRSHISHREDLLETVERFCMCCVLCIEMATLNAHNHASLLYNDANQIFQRREI